MLHRLRRLVSLQILLAHISDIASFAIVGEKMVKWLIPWGARSLGDRFVPFLAIGENRIDIEDYAPKTEQTVADRVSDTKTGMSDSRRRAIQWHPRGESLGCGFTVL